MVDRTTTMGDKYGKKGLANQRVQANSKYSHVGSTMSTGRTAASVTTFSKSFKISRLLFKSDHLISNSIRRQIDSKEAQREFLPTQCARTRRTSSGKPAISGSGIARRIQREYLRADGHRLDHDWRDRPRGRQCIGCELCRSESSRNCGWFELPGGRFEGQSRVDCLAHKGIV